MSVIFIAPAAGRQVNCKHFLGYTPGGEGGGVNYDAFPDFSRHPQFQNAECVPLIPGESVWDTGWRLATAYELEMRSQMYQVIRFLEEHPLSEQEYERLLDLAASSPLARKDVDTRLERLGLVEEYDSELGYSAIECTKLFYSQGYGQYDNAPYDGQLKLPYINVHGNLCYVSQHTAAKKVNEILRPELLKAWLEDINPETIIGRTAKCSGCPLATYIHSKLHLDVQVGNAWDLSSFSYEGVIHDLPEWASDYASLIDERSIICLDEESTIDEIDDTESLYPDYPSVPVKAKHALAILESYLKEVQS